MPLELCKQYHIKILNSLEFDILFLDVSNTIQVIKHYNKIKINLFGKIVAGNHSICMTFPLRSTTKIKNV